MPANYARCKVEAHNISVTMTLSKSPTVLSNCSISVSLSWAHCTVVTPKALGSHAEPRRHLEVLKST